MTTTKTKLESVVCTAADPPHKEEHGRKGGKGGCEVRGNLLHHLQRSSASRPAAQSVDSAPTQSKYILQRLVVVMVPETETPLPVLNGEAAQLETEQQQRLHLPPTNASRGSNAMRESLATEPVCVLAPAFELPLLRESLSVDSEGGEIGIRKEARSAPARRPERLKAGVSRRECDGKKQRMTGGCASLLSATSSIVDDESMSSIRAGLSGSPALISVEN
ncbi:hypothetical protein C8R45DRAFT_1183901 [Mycena sanguinolenta]|nr:hypothetical protein C8R45DRAFT_1183901 [Mycena sanguinolenta]